MTALVAVAMIEAGELLTETHFVTDKQTNRPPNAFRYGDSSTSPVFHPNRRTRILLSPDRGAGWITEAPRTASDAFLVWMLTYEPLIRALERHEHRGEC